MPPKINVTKEQILVALRTYKTHKEAADALCISHDTLEARIKEFEIGEVRYNKVLLWDLETGGINALQADLGFVLVFGWKWLGSNKVHTWKVCDYKNWFSKETGINDKPLLKDIVHIMESADLLVAHYGDKFDRRFFQGRCVVHGLTPPPPTKQRDTWRIAKSAFKFSSNRLGSLADLLSLSEAKHQKTRDEWPGWWFKAMAGNEQAINEMSVYCFTPDHKLLGEDLRWKAASDFVVGDTVLGFDEKGPHRRYKKAKIEKISYAEEPVYAVTLGSGHVLKVTKEHKWLVGQKRGAKSSQLRNFAWVETRFLAHSEDKYSVVPKLLNVWDEDQSNNAGWLGGIFDGEGCLGRRGGKLTVAQNPGIVLDKILFLLDKYAPGRTQRQIKSDCKCQNVTVRGPLFKQLEFLGTIRPERLISKINFDNLGRVECRNKLDPVVSIEPIGVQKIIKIQTSTGTLIVDGYPMHNCAQDVRTLEQVYLRIRQYDNPHPALFEDRTRCSVCGGEVEYRGIARVGVYSYNRYQCLECGRWGRDRKSIKEG